MRQILTSNEYDEFIRMKPEDRTADFGDKITNRIIGILIAYSKIYDIRDGWIDIITTKDAKKEIKQLIKDCGGSLSILSKNRPQKKESEMNNKQTPVEWFYEKIKSHLNGTDEDAVNMAYAIARQKERDAIIMISPSQWLEANTLCKSKRFTKDDVIACMKHYAAYVSEIMEREAYQAGYNNGNIDTCLTYDQWKEAKQ